MGEDDNPKLLAEQLIAAVKRYVPEDLDHMLGSPLPEIMGAIAASFERFILKEIPGLLGHITCTAEVIPGTTEVGITFHGISPLGIATVSMYHVGIGNGVPDAG